MSMVAPISEHGLFFVPPQIINIDYNKEDSDIYKFINLFPYKCEVNKCVV